MYNIVYSCDNNYSIHTGISIISLAESNKNKQLCIWIIENDISEENKNYLKKLSGRYDNIEIHFIDFAKYKDKLKLDMLWDISLSSYARLFIPEALPETVLTVLYLDSDTIVVGDIEEIFICLNQGIEILGVQDVTANNTKKSTNMSLESPYVNAGVLGLNVDVMRKNNRQEEFIRYIDSKNGKVVHHDQGVINAVFEGNIVILSPKYNYMTPFCTMTYNDIKELYELTEMFYDEKEFENCINELVIIHYTPGFVGRPWEKKCKHPLKDKYLNFKDVSPWREIPLECNKEKITSKIEKAVYTYLPVKFAKRLMETIKIIYRRIK